MAKLNPDIIPGNGDSVVVVDYEYTAASKAAFIAISDIDARGKETLHGPFKVGRSYGESAQRQSTDWGKSIERRASRKAQRDAKRKAEMLKRNRLRIERSKAVGE